MLRYLSYRVRRPIKPGWMLLLLFAIFIWQLILVSGVRAQLIAPDRFSSVLVFNQYTAFGARSAGMGNAYTTVANDLTAMYWNPAALTRVGDIALFVSGKYSKRDLRAESFSGNAFLDWQIESRSHLQFSYFGAAFRWSALKENIHIGFGIGKHGLFPENENYQLASVDGINYTWQNELLSGVTTSITGAVSIDLSNSLFLGAGIHFWTTDDEIISIIADQSIGSRRDTVFSQTRKMFDYANINFGFLFSGIQNLNLGLNLKLPYSIELRPLYIDDYETLVAAGYAYLKNIKINYPLALTTGLSYTLFSRFILAADYEYNPWSQIRIENPINEIEPDFNMHAWHIGLEYNWRTGFWQLPIRIGYYSQPTQIRESEGGQLRLPVFTAGASVQYKKFRLDLALEWMLISYTLSRFEFDPDHTLDNMSLKGDFYRVTLDFSLAAAYKE